MDEITQPNIQHYYVDEAGDPTIFKRRGKPIVGEPGCSAYFMLGLAEISNPIEVSQGLEALRKGMLADPYFANVPSFQPERNKTSIAFHAKDDVPEVRREVFAFLLQQEVRFYAVVRSKQVILEKITEHSKTHPDYKYHPNQLYDQCVSRLFKDRLHKADGYKIHFARRGSSDRTAAFDSAISQARHNYAQQHGVDSARPIQIVDALPKSTINLQVVDYYLWALQRAYERSEDRFIRLVSDQVGIIHDVDDCRDAKHGVYYTRKNPVTVDKIQ